MLSERALQECKNYSESRRQAASLYRAITDVIREFDGKVYNVRLERALKEAIKPCYVYCEKRFDKWIAVRVSTGRYNEWFDLVTIDIDDLTDGKRIPAEKMIESAQIKRAQLLEEAAQMEHFVENIDTICKQLESVKKTYNAIVDNLPYKGRDLLRVNHVY